MILLILGGLFVLILLSIHYIKKTKKFSTPFFELFMGVVGCVCFVIALSLSIYMLWQTSKILAGCKHTTATVVEITGIYISGSAIGMDMNIRYTTDKGKECTQHHFATTPNIRCVGDKISIVYSSSNPNIWMTKTMFYILLPFTFVFIAIVQIIGFLFGFYERIITMIASLLTIFKFWQDRIKQDCSEP
jgi:hypothetical protein